jgi:hypothetical protein
MSGVKIVGVWYLLEHLHQFLVLQVCYVLLLLLSYCMYVATIVIIDLQIIFPIQCVDLFVMLFFCMNSPAQLHRFSSYCVKTVS